MKTLLFLTAVLALPAGLFGQQQGGLLYSCRFDEMSNQSTAGLAAINEVRDDEVQYVWPEPGAAIRSKQFAPHLGYNMLVGDYDGDQIYHDPNLFGRIDALLRPRRKDGSTISDPLSMRHLFFSPRDDVLTIHPPLAPPMSSNLLESDVGRILPGGRFELFLSEAHVRSAFGIPNTDEVNLDAVCLHLDPNWAPEHQGIYLSFENTRVITIATGVFTVLDGAILRIPEDQIIWTVSAYDGESLLVQNVTPNSGQIILLEAEVDAMVLNSGVRDNAGNLCGTVVDVDGLTLPDAPGYFKSKHAPGPIHHLWFSGYRMTGAGILSTELGGSIPTLNGVPMGNAVGPTTGLQVGLVTPNVRSLDGLALTPDKLAHFVTDSPTPYPAAPGVIRVQIGGGAAVPGTILFWGLGVNALGGVDMGIPVAYAAFPEYFPHTYWNFVIIGADDCGEWAVNVPVGVYNYLVGITGNLRFQGFITIMVPPYWLSTPCKIQF